jgi:hypothetical protein
MIKLQLKWLVTLACVANCTFSSCMKEPEVQPEQSEPLEKDAATKEFEPLKLMSTNSTGTLAASSLEIGINGHPFTDAPYVQTSATKQISMLTGLGLKWYRINVQTRSDGSVTSSLFDSMRQAAAAGSVNLLPMLYLRTLDFSKSEAENYQQGRAVGGNFAAKYGKYFTMYDLGNDLELALLYANKTGASSSHYDRRKTNITASYLKGMDEGIKAKDAGAKTMIDAGWMHYGFLQMCASYGVKFDAIGYHWYSDMENAAPNAPTNILDITTKLASLFPTKQIWFTECNYRYKSSLSITENEAAQSKFIMSFVAKCKRNSSIKCLMFYELFDEPYKSYQESKFGLLKWVTRYTSTARKPSAGALANR